MLCQPPQTLELSYIPPPFQQLEPLLNENLLLPVQRPLPRLLHFPTGCVIREQEAVVANITRHGVTLTGVKNTHLIEKG